MTDRFSSHSRLQTRLQSRIVAAWKVDFSLLSPGVPLAAGALPGGGTYTQAAGANQTEETVQTSASTVARWAFMANLPRIGLLADGGIGLVLEPPRTNLNRATDALDNVGYWSRDAGVTVTASYVTSPAAGFTAVRVQSPSAAYGITNAGSPTSALLLTHSAWARSAIGAGAQVSKSVVGNPLVAVQINTTETWARWQLYTASAANPGQGHTVADGRATAGAPVAGARDEVAWGVQVEVGKYATNLIPSPAAAANVARAGFRVSIPLSRYVRGGVFRAVLTTVPHGAATEYDGDSATVRLWTIDANTYAEFATATRLLTVVVNGVSRAALVPLWWLKGHRVQWSWEVGNGNLRVRYRYSTDQGASWTLPFDPFGGTVYTDSAISTASSTVDLYTDSGSSKWFGTGVVSEEAILTAPAWALQWLPTDDPAVKAWFRADGHYTLSAGLVSAWTSQTAAAVSAAQGTGAFQPTFGAALVGGRPGFDFDGANDSLALSGLAIGAGDLLVSSALDIVATLGVDVGAILFDSLTGRAITTIRSTATSGNLGYYDNVAWRAPAAAPMTGLQVLTYDLRTSPGGRIYKDGVLQGTAQTYSAIGVGGQTAIGSSYNNTGSWMRARLGDFVVGAAQSDALRANLHAFYAAKYGLAVA